MPAAITISKLSWSTPDGRPLFSDLDLTFGPERTGLVGRNGVGKSTLLKIIAGTLPPSHGSVSQGLKIGLLRQTSGAEPGKTVADIFEVRRALDILARAERGEAKAEEITEADWSLEDRIHSALASLGMSVKPDTPLSTLSGGEYTRVALAALVFAKPDFLLLDEPSNHLDGAGRGFVKSLLNNWKGGAIVVSHDRDLLDTMDTIVELTSLGANSYGGNWSHYRAAKALELTAAKRDLMEAEKELKAVARATQALAERKMRRDSAGRRKASKGDAPRILLGAMKNRSEVTGANQAKLADKQKQMAREQLAAAQERIEILQPLSVTLPKSGLPPHKVVMRANDLGFAHDGGRLLFSGISFEIVGPERLAITGPNGSGKTTLLSIASGLLQPTTGSIEILADHVLLDQHVRLLDRSCSIRDNFRRLNPQADENACRSALARFMFRADAALQMVGSLSGGQMLRAGLACLLGYKPPALLILDEPTNHLDIDSLEEVEAGLRAYDGALVVVSHDEAFLENIGVSRRLALTREGAPRETP